jgi:hypothetical protein
LEAALVALAGGSSSDESRRAAAALRNNASNADQLKSMAQRCALCILMPFDNRPKNRALRQEKF